MKRAFLLFFLCACTQHPSEDECRAMLDRYVDMTIDDDVDLKNASEHNRPELRNVKKEEKRTSAQYKESLGRCTREVSRREHECAMKAPSPNEWEACL